MTQYAKDSDYVESVESPKSMAVELPLPLRGAFVNVEKSFFELCVDSEQEVLKAPMEQDLEDLFGPR